MPSQAFFGFKEEEDIYKLSTMSEQLLCPSDQKLSNIIETRLWTVIHINFTKS